MIDDLEWKEAFAFDNETITELEENERWNLYPYDEIYSPEPQNPWFFHNGLDTDTIEGKKSQNNLDNEAVKLLDKKYTKLIQSKILKFISKDYYIIGNHDDQNFDSYLLLKFVLNFTKEEISDFLSNEIRLNILNNIQKTGK